jgi:putative MATE family efflux protein
MDNMNHNVLDDERIGRLLLKLSIPAFFGMFVMTLYNVVDTIFIGHYVGSLGIAALSIVFPVQMLSMGMGMMTGMGGASLISRLIGGGEVSKAEHALGNAVSLTIVLSATIMIAGLANADFWLSLIGASEDVLPYARDYMTIILIGMIFMSSAMALNNLVRSEGNARVPMIGMIIGAGLNIILDAIFVIPLNMGVMGAALATVIAQLISFVYLMSYYLTGKGFLKIHKGDLIPELDILKGIFAIGIASFAMTVATSIASVFVNRVLVSYGGDLAVSAYGIIHRIMMFAMMPGMVVGQGLQPILGFNYGAKRYGRALKAITIALTAATAISAVSFFILYFSPEPFMRIFTTDSALISLGSYALKRIFLVLYLIAFIMSGSVVFQAMGKALPAFISSISRPFLFLMPLIFILPNFLQLEGVWLAFPITDGLTFLVVLALFIPQVMRLRRMSMSAKK